MTIKPSAYNVVYGFEEYSLYNLRDRVFTDNVINTVWDVCTYSDNDGTYIPTVYLTIPVYRNHKYSCIPNFAYPCYKDNKQLLATAKKLFIHPECKLSRTIVGSKYSKCLDKWTADAVVVPKWDDNELCLQEIALFLNEEANILLRIPLNDASSEKLHAMKLGTTFRKAASCAFDAIVDSIEGNVYDMYNAELIYVGDSLYVPKHKNYIVDVLVNNFPTDKTVFEDTVQASLGTEENKFTFDNLVSIEEMVSSSDENSVSAALKALSTMDYVHYANSIRYVLNTGYGSWRWNKATNSTPVKFMLKFLYKTSRKSRFYGRFDDEIYEEDYNLIKELIKHYENVPDDQLNNTLATYSFVCISPEGIIVPKLKAAI